MSSTTNTTYADWLRQQMDAEGLSQRQLGARLTPESPEIGRRAIRRYLKGMIPIERTRVAISAALGTDDLGPDGDAEDD